MEKAAEATQAPAPKAEAKPEEAVVTLQHSDWGSYVFRMDASKLASAFPAQVSAARKAADVRAKVEALDSEQRGIEKDVDRARAKVAAAEVLNDTAAKTRAEKEVEALRARQNALAQTRAKLLES